MIGWILGGVALLVIFFFAITYLCYRKAFICPPIDTEEMPFGDQYSGQREEMLAMIRYAVSLPFEEVRIESYDGVRLYGRYYETEKGAPLQILFHGYHGNPLRDFSGGLPLSLESGYNALLIDQRGTGKSGGRCVSFGVRERWDCIAWAEYAKERFGEETPVVLTGISMGAATVLMASSLPLPENVKGMIADCGYTTPRAIIEKVVRDRHLPAVSYHLLRLGARIYGGFDPEEPGASAPEALRQAKLPVLFIHGEDDLFVPCDMTRENYEACASEKTLFTVKGAGHGLSYMTDNEGYRSAVATFLEKTGKR